MQCDRECGERIGRSEKIKYVERKEEKRSQREGTKRLNCKVNKQEWRKDRKGRERDGRGESE